ncbi:GNAT family N-acetyltransferase [Nakamurella endophytica]|uniref:Acetyltransferase n=1 Tax=Nakamurella endophytica TaxID=1748367 RepID=A0A917WGD9_9ACTN|nr:GNAT family protein [Nakamurella endophytica]GGM00922.1 acetyltransferase [Nakamurella endophytica]
MTVFADKPTLQGSRVLLRPFRPSDVDAMGPVLADPDVLRLTGSVHSTDEALGRPAELDLRTRRWYETRAEQTDRLDLAVVDRERDRCVGEVVLNEWDAANLSCNFRILLGLEGRDRGLGTEAIRMLLDHAFAATPVHRIGLEVLDVNPRARHVYQRCGFREEGRLRAAFRFDGQWVDSVLMSVLREDREPG